MAAALAVRVGKDPAEISGTEVRDRLSAVGCGPFTDP
jgi:hypothetical protein